MAEVTVRVPEELKRMMDRSPGMNWEAVAREALWERARQLALMRAFTEKSRFTERDALRLGRKVNRAVARRYRELLGEPG